MNFPLDSASVETPIAAKTHAGLQPLCFLRLPQTYSPENLLKTTRPRINLVDCECNLALAGLVFKWKLDYLRFFFVATELFAVFVSGARFVI